MNPYQPLTPLQRWLIVIAVMASTLMEVIDMTIVNVALPSMQGSLGATTDQISWVLTSYIVSAAILMPLTGYFTDRFGTKKFLLLSMVGFLIASVLCGIATTLSQIVFFRLLQGIFGASLVPLSQAIMTDMFPAEERGKAMAIWGMGVILGPIFGPMLGGYLTETTSWRFNFYINIPFALAAIFIIWHVMPKMPEKIRQMDWVGFSCIATAIGSLQYILDRGNISDWYHGTDIRWASILGLLGVVGFFINKQYQTSKFVFDAAIFKDKNFVVSSFLMCALGLGMFGGMVILPLMLQSLFDYPAITSGLMTAPRGLFGMLGMIIVSKLIRHTDPRLLIGTGLVFSFLGTYPSTCYDLSINQWWIIWPMFFQGMGMGLIFVPLSAVAFSTLPAPLRAEASGIYSLMRALGSSMGISILITIFTRHTQIAWSELGSFINPYNPAVSAYLNHLHMTVQDPQAPSILATELSRQSQMIAFLNVYSFVLWSFVVMMPFVLLITPHNAPHPPLPRKPIHR